MFARLLLAFTVIPVAELYLLISIGERVGTLETVCIVLITGLVGAALAKREGLRILEDWRQAQREARLPADGVISGLLVLVSAVLLVTPGVLTDVVGLSMLIPGIRRGVANAIRASLERRMASGEIQFVGGVGASAPQSTQRPTSNYIDTEYVEVETPDAHQGPQDSQATSESSPDRGART